MLMQKVFRKHILFEKQFFSKISNSEGMSFVYPARILTGTQNKFVGGIVP